MKAVVDTNVLLVANGLHAEVSPACLAACVSSLLALRQSGTVVLDDRHEVLGEYLEKLTPGTGKGPGAAFLKHLLQNLGNPARVSQVRITPDGRGGYAEFPDKELQKHFDPADRKFPATANAHPDKPPILQASDCKWLDWWQALALYGIDVRFLCPDDLCQFYRHKFPQRKVPALPGSTDRSAVRKRGRRTRP